MGRLKVSYRFEGDCGKPEKVCLENYLYSSFLLIGANMYIVFGEIRQMNTVLKEVHISTSSCDFEISCIILSVIQWLGVLVSDSNQLMTGSFLWIEGQHMQYSRRFV